jgi:sulfonate transport system substrate-binding protein
MLALLMPLAQAQEVLRVSSQKDSLKILLQAAGELDSVPYRIEFASFAAAAPTAEALRAGAVDIGALGDAPFVFVAASNAPIRVVGVIKLRVTPTMVAMVVNSDSPLQRVEDLVGKRITTTRGSIGHYLALALLRSVGLHGDDVRFIFLQPGDSRILLANGGADAWATWDPYTSMARLEGETRVLASGQGTFAGNMLLVANQQAIDDKDALIDDFLHRLERAYRWAGKHVDEISALQARSTGLPVEVHRISNIDAQAHRVEIDRAIIDALQTTADLYREEKIIPVNIKSEDWFDKRFHLE